jgi:uncharacterized membrane protein YjgN (DUF898 family)
MNLSFKLTGKDWIGLYLAALVFYFVPIIAMQFQMRHIATNIKNLAYAYGIFLFAMVLMLILTTPILKKFIGSIYIDDKPLAYDGQILRFLLLNIGNGLLSVITLFIYFPWFLTKVIRYIVSRTSFNDSRLSFNGKGGQLFVVLLLTLVVPMILVSVLMMIIITASHGGVGFVGDVGFVAINAASVANQIIMFVILIPYVYYVYRWMVNLSYKDYVIRWNTQAIPSMGIILREFVLTLITIGIYHPVAFAKLYQYFMNRTFITQQDRQAFSFKVTFDYFKLWKFIWVQILLTIVTAGIYGAWAYCKGAALFVNNTSIVKVESA